MKKINLTVPKPCHENWDQMTPDEQGRFCGACQKTVIDFTNMSDRELAAFFKKPMGSMCGRFHQDQLNREIAVPKKRIPWLRYFFHIAWPAFILMLKSCVPKDRVAGEVAITQTLNIDSANENNEVVILGALKVPDSLLVETVVETEPVVKGKIAIVEVMGEPDTSVADNGKDSVVSIPLQDTIMKVQEIELPDPNIVTLDTVTITERGSQSCGRITMGAVIAGVKIISINEPVTTNVADEKKEAANVQVYPNPAKAGEVLNLRFTEADKIPVGVQLLTATGQRLLHRLLNDKAYTANTSIQLPGNLSAGVYFVQVQFADGSVEKSTVLVTQ